MTMGEELRPKFSMIFVAWRFRFVTSSVFIVIQKYHSVTRRSRNEDNFPHLFSPCETVMSLDHVGKGKCPIQNRGKPLLRNEPQDLKQARLRPHRRSQDLLLLDEDVTEVDLHLEARRGSARDEPS